jgi:hypothetical protein
MAEVLYGADLEAEKIAQDLALPETFVQDVLARYASEHDIAASNRRRKVVNIETGLKRRDKPQVLKQLRVRNES